MDFGIYLNIAIALLLALLASKVMKILKLPNVTGYLVFGLITGPYVLKIFTLDTINSLSIIPSVALGFIAFSVGGEFKLSFLKRTGKVPLVIGFTESFFAVILVDIVLILFGIDPAFSIVLGSIAAATAPAATLMVVKQYKAKGPVTETLLPVVAIDDAYAIMLFGISVAIANAITMSTTSIAKMILEPIIEIFGSLISGAILGYILKLFTDWFTGRGNRLSLVIVFVFAGIGIANLANFSPLLLCMALSAVYVNTSKASDKVFELVERFTPPIFILFFFISGAQLDITILPTVGLIGVIYIVVRVIGKVLGALVGAKLTHADPKVDKYLGWTLLPQAGVAIGLITVAMTVVPHYGEQLRAIILSATVIYELTGPLITKMALKKAGEIQENPEKVTA